MRGASPPPTPSFLAQVEEALEIRLPGAFRAFLARHNGGEPTVPTYRDSSSGELRRVDRFLAWDPADPAGVFAALEAWGERVPPGTLPIATGGPGGGILLLGVDEPWGGCVLLWDPGRSPELDAAGNATWVNVHPVAEDFVDFLERFEAPG